MQQYHCGHCGYDMTGVETFANNLGEMMVQQFNNVTPVFSQGLYNTNATNTVKCPQCGKTGYWINTI